MEGESRTGQCSESDRNNDTPDESRESHDTHDDGRDSDGPSQITRELHGTLRMIGTFPR